MNRQHLIFFFILVCISCNKNDEKIAGDSKDPGKEVPAKTYPIELADPAIFFHDGTYYLYGTGGDVNKGFLVYTSTDLKMWDGPKGATAGYALVKGDTYGTAGFWAPQVFQYEGKIYMAYTANEQLVIAQSDSPLGPFKQTALKKLSGAEKQIDPYVFFDDDGKIYLYHVRLINGNNLYVAEMKDDLSDIKIGTEKLCIQADQPWEDTERVSWKVTEGPTVIKHNALYYFFYSANDFRNIDYAVGYATSASPLGPWVKYPGNPIISRNIIPQNGTGHGDFFTDADGNLRYVFHIHASRDEVHPRKTILINAVFSKDISGDDIMKVDSKSVIYPSTKYKVTY